MDDQIPQDVSTQGDSQAPSQIVINGVEYDPQEAESLIGLGKKTQEYEQRWNTSLDKVWPAYGESQSRLKSVESELNQARQQLSQFEQKKDAGVETPADVAQAKEAARKLGIVLNDDLENHGYIKRDDLDKYLNERDERNKAVNAIISKADELEKSITGEDGRPAFNKRAILAYAQAYGFEDLEKAYEDMHSGALKSWQDAQVAAKKGQPLKTLDTKSQKSPPDRKQVDNDNVEDQLSEALFGSAG